MKKLGVKVRSLSPASPVSGRGYENKFTVDYRIFVKMSDKNRVH